MQYCHRLSRHWRCSWREAPVSQHVCKFVPFMHITLQLMELSCTLDLATKTFSLHSLPVSCLCIYFFFILMSCATCTSELQLNLRTGPSEVCTCSPPSFLFGMRRRIASEHDILQWTQRWHQDNRLHSSVEPHSLTTRSRLEMFTLNIWDVFQLALDCVLFLYSLYFL